MAVSLRLDPREPRLDEESGAKTLAVAFAIALALHVGALALLARWRSTANVAPPIGQEIAIDLGPQIIEAPSIEPNVASQPVVEPAEAVPVELPPETVAAVPVAPDMPTEPPTTAEAVPPPETVSPVVEAPASPLPAPSATQSVTPFDLTPVEAVEADAVILPPPPVTPPEAQTVIAALPPPDPVTAQPLPEPQEIKPPPVERPTPERTQPIRREPPRPVPQRTEQGTAGQTQRPPARGAASRENPGSAAGTVDPSLMSRYAAQLTAALRARLRYPSGVGAGGVAVLRFTMDRSGRVLTAAISRSAGNAALDDAALAAAAPGSSLPPVPDGLPQQRLTISVPLRFGSR